MSRQSVTKALAFLRLITSRPKALTDDQLFELWFWGGLKKRDALINVSESVIGKFRPSLWKRNVRRIESIKNKLSK